MTTSQDAIPAGVQNQAQLPIFIINSQNGPAIGDQNKPSNDSRAKQAEPTSDWWIVIPTLVMAGATVALWWVGNQQRIATARQADYMRDSLAETRTATTAAVLNAEAANVIQHEEGASFLMPNTSIFITPNIPPLAHDVYGLVQAGQASLFLMGYVEYRDRVGRKHRSGYARRYDPSATTNNLLYVTKRGYNYDIEIDEQGNPVARPQG